MRVYWAIPVLASILILGTIGFSQNVYAPDISGLVVHYDFEDELNPTADLSGHGNDGTLVGGATFSTDVPPIPNNLHSLDLLAGGTADYLIATPTPFPSSAITVAFWVKSPTTPPAIPAFVSYAEAVGGFNDVVIQNLFIGVEACFNDIPCTPAGTLNILDGTWHHIAVTWRSSDGETKIYADGTPTTHTTAPGTFIDPLGTLVLGQEQDSVGGGFDPREALVGLLDDVRIYDRVLSDEEIEELFDPIIEVDIDIKPGSDPNCFKSDGHGVIPVAILGSATFDATQVDPLTLELDSQTVKTKGNGAPQTNIEDVNGDGFDDLVVKIIDTDGTYTVGTGTATLTGQLLDGTPIEGTDSICITQ